MRRYFVNLRCLMAILLAGHVFLAFTSWPILAAAGEEAVLQARLSTDSVTKTLRKGSRSKQPLAGLSRFPDRPIAFQNYQQTIHPIEGPQSKLLPGWTFSFDNVIVTPQSEVIARITHGSNAAFKWELEKLKQRTQGRYIVEVTLPKSRPGVVAAPLWLYSEGAREGGHEFDFEFINGRIEYNLHNGHGGYNMRTVRKDLGGHRVRLEIIRRPNRVTMRVESLTNGFKDRLVVTPNKVRKWAKKPGAPKKLRWPPNTTAMFPVMEFWVANAPSWVGEWQPLAEGESIEMTIHGYSFTDK